MKTVAARRRLLTAPRIALLLPLLMVPAACGAADEGPVDLADPGAVEPGADEVAEASQDIVFPTGMDAEDDTVCAILGSNSAVCWGKSATGGALATPRGVPEFGDSASLAVGSQTVVSVTTSGQQRWAYVGQPASALMPGAGNNNLALDVGLYHTCRVLTTGAVQCYGKNQYGQLGNNSRTDATAWVAVQGISDAVSVAVGEFYSCARRTGGQLMCWGHGSYVGDTTAGDNLTAANVAGMTNVRAYSVGNRHACATQGTGGAVHCWGLNFAGQLGDGTTTARTTPVPVNINATAVAAGQFHSCAIQSGASWNVKCWGNNNWVELGTTAHGSSKTTPVAVPAPSPTFTPTVLAAGSHFTCAMQTGAFGNVACWGENDKGQLGNNQVGVNTTTQPAIVLGNDLIAQGFTCTTHGQCLSGSCVDGFCCNTFCGGAVTTDCQACSFAAGGVFNGVCASPLRPGFTCTP